MSKLLICGGSRGAGGIARSPSRKGVRLLDDAPLDRGRDPGREELSLGARERGRGPVLEARVRVDEGVAEDIPEGEPCEAPERSARLSERSRKLCSGQPPRHRSEDRAGHGRDDAAPAPRPKRVRE